MTEEQWADATRRYFNVAPDAPVTDGMIAITMGLLSRDARIYEQSLRQFQDMTRPPNTHNPHQR